VRITRLLGGRWEWDGELGYGKGGVEFDGTLRGFDLTYRGAPIGSLQARIAYHDDALAFEEGELRLDEASSVRLRGRIDFRGAGTVAVEATATNFPLEPALAAIGIPAPAHGRLTGPVVITGRPDALAGRATVEAAPFAVAGVPFDRLQGELIFTPDLLELRGVILSLGEGRIAVDGRIPYLSGDWLPAEGEASPGLRLDGHDLDLSLLPQAAGVPGLLGTASLEGRIEGALAAPGGSIVIQAADVQARGARIGDVRARIDLEGRAARIDLQAPARGLSITGRVGLGAGEPSDLRAVLTGTQLSGQEIVRGSPEDARIVLSGEVQARGLLATPERVEARAVLDRVEVAMSGVRLAARAPVEVTLLDGKLALAPVAFAGEGTEVELRGMVDPGAAGLIDLAASGSVDLKLLRLFVKGLQASGTARIAMKVGGPLASPVFEGSLKADAEAMRHPDLPFPIDRLKTAAVFEENRLKIETLEFLAGGGLVQGTGEVLLGDLERSESPFAIRRAAVRFQGSNVHADYPDGLRSTSDVDVTLSRERGETLLSGTIDLIRSVYAKDFRLDKGMAPARAGDALRAEPGGPLAGVNLDLLIRAQQDAWLRNDFGAIEGQGELRVRGTADRPSLSGRITAVEGGTIRFRGVSYRVLAGSMDFSDPEVIDPFYDLQAETHVSEYQVTLHAEGTMGDFRYELTSNPPLPEQDIVSLLLTGRTLGAFGQEGGGLAEETISTYLTGRLTGELTDRVTGRAGIDLFSIDPLQANAQGDPTTRITVGKQVTPDLFVAYSSDLSSTQGAIYQLDYALSRDFHFASLRDRDGSIGGDFKYILRGKPPMAPGIVEPAAPAPILGEIRIDGDLKTKKETRVRRILRVRKGRPRDRSAINQGVDRLLKSYRDRGYLMADVDYDETPAADGRVNMTFHVRPGPRVAIDFEGTRGRAALRQEVEPFWQKGLFMEDIVEQARARVEAVLKDRGYQKAAIASAIDQVDPDLVRVRFTVTRGPRTRASGVRIAGPSRLTEKEVRKVIRTAPDGPLSRGLVRDATLAQDSAAVLALYRARGFPLARVPLPEVVLDDTGRTAEVTFHIEEGPQVMLGPPRFEGNGSFYPVLLRKAAALKAGLPYTAESIDRALVGLRRLYDEHGYPDVRVTCRPLAAGATESQGAGEYPVVESPVFDIEEGRHQMIGEVRIAGNVLTHDEVIRKSLTIDPGTSLSRGDLQASQTRLYGLGVFRSVAIEPEPLPAGPPGEASLPEGAAAPPGILTRDVTVSVRELPPLTQVFGLGFDTEEKLRGQYEISNRNIFGSGRYLGLQARGSDVQQRGALSYREKGLFGGRHDLLASAFAENEKRPAFDVRTIGSSIQMSRRITRATRTLYRYSLKDVNLSDTTAAFDGSTLRLASLATSVLHDTRDALFDPLRGHYLGGEVQFFGHGIGSEADFVKMYAQIYRFKQVFPRTVWAQALRAGACVPFGRSKDDPAATGDALSGVPPSERFFAGGDTTVRGFRRDHLGPDVNGDPVGGEGLFVFNQELRFPIFRMLGGVVFYDAGNVYRTLSDYDVWDLRHVAGFGLRLATPIGPFRVEYGAILDREPDERRGELFFSIGQAF
jgi:outer membrane protein assembly complex protein YaeT